MTLKKSEAVEYIHNNPKQHLTPDRSGKGFVCPSCLSGQGKHGTGMSTKDGIHFTCWSCDDIQNADVIDIIGVEYGIPKDDFPAKLRKAAEIYGITLEDDYPEKKEVKPVKKQEEKPRTDYTPFYQDANKHLQDTSYHRGISLDTLNRFHVGYCPDWVNPEKPNTPSSPRLIIPTSPYTYLARDTREGVENYAKIKVGGKVEIFNAGALTTAVKPVYVVEGEIDALSVIDAGGEAIGLGGTSKKDDFIELVKRVELKQPLILALDNDKPGQDAENWIAEKLDLAGIPFTRFDITQGKKDANEALNADKATFREIIHLGIDEALQEQEEAIERKRESIKREAGDHTIDNFLEFMNKRGKSNTYPTGFEKLDKILKGGLHTGFYVFGALSGLGKTSFCLQVADQIAQQGFDVLFFSLEMPRNELIARSVSRATFLRDEAGYIGSGKTIETWQQFPKKPVYAIETSELLTGELEGSWTEKTKKRELLDHAVEDYREYGKHLFIVEVEGKISIEGIGERVRKHKEILGVAPVVFIDYLQLIKADDVHATDKQNTDRAVMALKQLSRDYEIPVVAISSFNRENYNSTVNLASFKESGGIEYSSDVLIGMQLKGMDTQKGDEKPGARQERISNLKDWNKEQVKRGGAKQLQVKVLKNRIGLADEGEDIYFFPGFNYYQEEQGSSCADWVRSKPREKQQEFKPSFFLIEDEK